jgi:hypothetical protein
MPLPPANRIVPARDSMFQYKTAPFQILKLALGCHRDFAGSHQFLFAGAPADDASHGAGNDRRPCG